MFRDVIYRVNTDIVTGTDSIIKPIQPVTYCQGCRYAKKSSGEIKCTLSRPYKIKTPMGFCDEGSSNVIPMKE